MVELHGLENELYPEFGKLGARAIAESAGVETPLLLAGPISAAELEISEYGDEFVIKPNWGASSRGILVLRRKGEDSYVDLMSGALLNAEQIRERVSLDVRSSGRGSPSNLIVESSMARGDILPTDWKVYTFYGRVGLILQIDRSEPQSRSKFHSPDWKDLGRVRRDKNLDRGLPDPVEPDRILEAAIAISQMVPTGFLRVDLYEAPNAGGVVFGELCLLPGGDQYYKRGLDRTLAGLWDDAEVRLMSERKPLIP